MLRPWTVVFCPETTQIGRAICPLMKADRVQAFTLIQYTQCVPQVVIKPSMQVRLARQHSRFLANHSSPLDDGENAHTLPYSRAEELELPSLHVPLVRQPFHAPTHSISSGMGPLKSALTSVRNRRRCMSLCNAAWKFERKLGPENMLGFKA